LGNITIGNGMGGACYSVPQATPTSFANQNTSSTAFDTRVEVYHVQVASNVANATFAWTVFNGTNANSCYISVVIVPLAAGIGFSDALYLYPDGVFRQYIPSTEGVPRTIDGKLVTYPVPVDGMGITAEVMADKRTKQVAATMKLLKMEPELEPSWMPKRIEPTGMGYSWLPPTAYDQYQLKPGSKVKLTVVDPLSTDGMRTTTSFSVPPPDVSDEETSELIHELEVLQKVDEKYVVVKSDVKQKPVLEATSQSSGAPQGVSVAARSKTPVRPRMSENVSLTVQARANPPVHPTFHTLM